LCMLFRIGGGYRRLASAALVQLIQSDVMQTVVVATPLRNSTVSRPYAFGDGITIQAVSPILWDVSIVTDYISKHDREELQETRYWLCATRDVESANTESDELYDAARQAMYALQIIFPSGCKNVYLKFHKRRDGYDNLGSCHPTNMKTSLLGRIISAEDLTLARDFDAVYAGVRSAFGEGIVRIQNPILLLEHAMQTGNVPLCALMCVMGLDMLFMGGQKIPFVERIGGFLGLESYVFPLIQDLDEQPSVCVKDVLADLYELRNKLAHGLEIPEQPYRQRYDLVSIRGNVINAGPYSYIDLMFESGLFLLTTALRKIFVERLFGDVREKDKWKTKMTLYEHRFKESGGVTETEKGR